MALKTPYVTLTEANVYLKDNVDWGNLDTSQKNNHLVNGRYFMDSNYTCTVLASGAETPEEYKYANSLLAEIDLATGLFTVDKTVNSPVVKKRVKAGDVESETIYAGGNSSSLRMNGVDPYPVITSILNEFCYMNKTSGVSMTKLARA